MRLQGFLGEVAVSTTDSSHSREVSLTPACSAAGSISDPLFLLRSLRDAFALAFSSTLKGASRVPVRTRSGVRNWPPLSEPSRVKGGERREGAQCHSFLAPVLPQPALSDSPGFQGGGLGCLSAEREGGRRRWARVRGLWLPRLPQGQTRRWVARAAGAGWESSLGFGHEAQNVALLEISLQPKALRGFSSASTKSSQAARAGGNQGFVCFP